MRKHRLYGFSLAMLAASGTAVAQWPGQSQATAATNSGGTRHHGNHHRRISVADYVDSQLHAYLVEVGTWELNQFFVDVANFVNWMNAAQAQAQAQAQWQQQEAAERWAAGVEASQSYQSSAPTEQQTSSYSGGSSYSGYSGGYSGGIAACIRQAENGGSYAWGTGDGGGAYQFEPSTWVYANQLDGGNPNNTSPANQDAAFSALYQAEGLAPWSGDPCVG